MWRFKNNRKEPKDSRTYPPIALHLKQFFVLIWHPTNDMPEMKEKTWCKRFARQSIKTLPPNYRPAKEENYGKSCLQAKPNLPNKQKWCCCPHGPKEEPQKQPNPIGRKWMNCFVWNVEYRNQIELPAVLMGLGFCRWSPVAILRCAKNVRMSVLIAPLAMQALTMQWNNFCVHAHRWSVNSMKSWVQYEEVVRWI